jgi:hypothetical protein
MIARAATTTTRPRRRSDTLAKGAIAERYRK